MKREKFKYFIYESGPIDHFSDFVSISRFAGYLEMLMRTDPQCGFTYDQIWSLLMNMIHWSWTNTENMDLDLRSSMVFIKFYSKNHYPLGVEIKMVILFKADNNGTMYAISTHSKEEFEIPHEFDMDWELLNPQKIVAF